MNFNFEANTLLCALIILNNPLVFLPLWIEIDKRLSKCLMFNSMK